jgi:hypothetical protein
MRFYDLFKSSKALHTSNTKYKLPVRILLEAFIIFRLFSALRLQRLRDGLGYQAALRVNCLVFKNIVTCSSDCRQGFDW